MQGNRQLDICMFSVSAPFKVRKENFGGLVFVPATGLVLQVNKRDYLLLKRILFRGRIIARKTEELVFWQNLVKRKLIKEEVLCEK